MNFNLIIDMDEARIANVRQHGGTLRWPDGKISTVGPALDAAKPVIAPARSPTPGADAPSPYPGTGDRTSSA